MEHLFTAFEGTADGTFVIDRQQNIVFWNRSAEEILGYSAEEALGRKCYDLLKGCDLRGQVICRAKGLIFSSVQEGEPVRHFDLMVRHREGHSVPIDVSTIPFIELQQDGKPPGLVHIFHSIEETQSTASTGLRTYLLGPVVVRLPDDSTVDGPLWQRVKVRALYVYLLLQHGLPVSREKIIDTLWPDMDYRAALRNLNTTVYNLRRSLEPGITRGSDSRYVIYESGSYRLNCSSDCWLDIKAFDADIRAARLEPNVDRAIALYEEALNLYRGEYLADLELSGVFSYGERHRLRERCLAALEEVGVLYEAHGLDVRAKNRYLRALTIEPWRETAAQKLMHLFMRLGDRASAARTCLQLTEQLTTELDMQPSRETQLLCKLARCDGQL